MRYQIAPILTLLLLFTWFFNTGQISAQRPTMEEIFRDVDPSDSYSLQAAMNTYHRLYPEAKGEKQWRRKEWWLEPRLYPHGRMENLPVKTLAARERYMRSLSPQQRSTHGGWLFLGPSAWEPAPPPGGGNSGLGRINSIELHP